ncbi:MAG: peroxidase-related enzyme [Crocinitomix sp.]|nr:peroxidase-related enzyme [Crocinitomix sp.]
MANIEVIDYEGSTGRLHEIYDDLIAKRGKLAGVHTIQSLRPESIVKHIELYMEIMFSRSELSRAKREMLAVIVSISNNCEYCQLHHASALNHYWKAENKLTQLKTDFELADIDEQELALCRYAKIVTIDPGKANNENLTEPLKVAGLSDSAILDATLVISYFNFVNRIVLSLGVESSDEEIEGYKY